MTFFVNRIYKQHGITYVDFTVRTGVGRREYQGVQVAENDLIFDGALIDGAEFVDVDGIDSPLPPAVSSRIACRARELCAMPERGQ